MTNSVTYYGAELITTVKSFIAKDPDWTRILVESFYSLCEDKLPFIMFDVIKGICNKIFYNCNLDHNGKACKFTLLCNRIVNSTLFKM